MIKKNKLALSDIDKQNTPLPNEVSLKSAFTKLTVIAKRTADRYKLKDLKIEANVDK